ncbi:Cytochrome P450 3A24 like protein [Argiope bruennichi]|uniref:Cytochrome P450 3A24 like protein n=1 Tax=Argiope bruennichi TaxID=94029 RepID=A0A8T0FDE5_ARGBR|nr:Cytochrome P450 3A24 like protein [Argiope bruennichi]
MWALTFFAVAVVLWLIYRKRCFSVLKKMGIPGPEPNILFGNMLEIMMKTPIKCHEEWLKKYGNIVGYYFGATPIVLVADVDLLKRIEVSDFHKFINRPNLNFRLDNADSRKTQRVEGFSQQLLLLRDKKWKEIRSIITPSFTASKMKQMAPIMNSAIDSLVSNVEKKCSADESFDIYPMYQGLTMDVIGRTAFGIQTDLQNNPDDPLLRCSKVFFDRDIRNPILLLGFSFHSLNIIWNWLVRLILIFKNKGTNPIKELTDSVKKVIETRRRNKENRRPDLLQLMIDAEIDLSAVTSDDLIAKGDTENTEKETNNTTFSKLVRKMTDADILDNSLLFFLAGYETTSTALAFTTHFLIHHPEKRKDERVNLTIFRKQVAVLDQVFHESLRFYPPVYQLVSRECSEDMELGNIKLKKGMAVQVPVYHVHRDPKLWGPDVEEFKPERFVPENKSKIHPMAYQAFGQGPRNCVGMRFAYMEVKLALARLLSKYRFRPCSQTEQEPLTLKITPATINPKRGIWTKAEPL